MMTRKYKSTRKSTNTRKYKSTRKQIGGSPTPNSTNGSGGYMTVRPNISANNKGLKGPEWADWLAGAQKLKGLPSTTEIIENTHENKISLQQHLVNQIKLQ